MLQILIGSIVFILVAFAAIPYWRHRRISGIPGAYYLEQKFQALVVDLWRDFKAGEDGGRHHHGKPDRLAALAREFVPFFTSAVEAGYDSELELYLKDFVELRSEAELQRAVACVVIDYEGRDNPLLRQQAMVYLLG